MFKGQRTLGLALAATVCLCAFTANTAQQELDIVYLAGGAGKKSVERIRAYDGVLFRGGKLI